MKRLILPLCLLLLCGCEKEVTTEIEKEDVVENIIEEEEVIEEPTYVDTNPIKLNLYIDSPNGGLDKITDTYETTWIKKKDIVVFGAIYSDEEKLSGTYFQDIWFDAAEKYEGFENYKIGWEVSFELKDGTKIDQMIYKFSDVSSFYDYLEIYLYDSANVPKDTWYSHILDDEITDETYLTSMKLTAGSLYEEIVSPISVMAFTYDSDDFNDDGSYKGISYIKVDVINSSTN